MHSVGGFLVGALDPSLKVEVDFLFFFAHFVKQSHALVGWTAEGFL